DLSPSRPPNPPHLNPNPPRHRIVIPSAARNLLFLPPRPSSLGPSLHPTPHPLPPSVILSAAKDLTPSPPPNPPHRLGPSPPLHPLRRVAQTKRPSGFTG